MITKQYRTGALFDCETCGKQWQGLDDARQKAYQHAKKSGHHVRGEIVTAYHYKFTPVKEGYEKMVKKKDINKIRIR